MYLIIFRANDFFFTPNNKKKKKFLRRIHVFLVKHYYLLVYYVELYLFYYYYYSFIVQPRTAVWSASAGRCTWLWLQDVWWICRAESGTTSGGRSTLSPRSSVVSCCNTESSVSSEYPAHETKLSRVFFSFCGCLRTFI